MKASKNSRIAGLPQYARPSLLDEGLQVTAHDGFGVAEFVVHGGFQAEQRVGMHGGGRGHARPCRASPAFDRKSAIDPRADDSPAERPAE